ncbi:ABC transporter substrate-binding protein [Nesterenkonia sandarakina]|uniref:Peptide/nickel transport system substrate-binding protein n=1 Tax=Nesterenkonia sandarakina TaxID=272918 RepID=A0A2T0YGZ5_9MICC|nr:ABC transporter substrate-binding protein [Nesterenkonia sandarakina]PRZ14146.1 peptide/nickel transport system substrate-binding protein [Nesterenkonia sandarakina]
MKLRKLSAATAILATGALVLSGCTPDGGNDDAEAADTGNGETNGEASGSTDAFNAEGQQFTTEPEDTGKADTSDLETMEDEISVSMGEIEFVGYNGQTPESYSVYNSTVVNRIFEGFGYWGTDNVWYANEDFGSYEVISEDPFTVEYTIGEDVSWSDGTPVTVADYVLDWAYQNASLTNSDDEPLFNGISQTYGERVLEGPQGDPEGKTFTIEYTEPFADWEILVNYALPAHVVAEQSDMELDELVTAIRDADTEALEPAAEFWNEGWLTDPGTLPDEELIPVTGPYTLDNWQAGESLTITANEEYWGNAPGTESIVFRFVNDGQHVQALENGDLNVARPQATVDTRGQLERLEGQVVLHEGEAATWEHLDFNFIEGGTFAESLELREAFAMCVPRQQIVSNLVEPVNPEASVLNARESLTFEENYEDIVAESYDGTYDEVDVEGAAEILEAEDAVGTEVRIGYAAPNPRRTDTVAEIKASCDEAGFEIVDSGSEDFFGPGGAQETGDYEVALFAWAGSGQVVSGQNIYSTDRPQNYGGYSNETVDDLFNQLATTEDADEQQEIIIGIEQELWGDLFGIPLYVHPQLSGSDISISNVRDTASQDQIVWNAEQWQRAE